MENINLKLKQNENGGAALEDYHLDNNFDNHRKTYEEKPDKKTVEDIWNDVDSLNDNVKNIKDLTSVILAAYKSKLCDKLKGHYNKYRKELMADSLKKQEQDEDPFVREKSLNEQLELMTKMAQDLDKEHRKLTNQERRLKIEYSSQ